jgi:hypothetical protein
MLWLRAGRPRDRNSSPGRVKNFLFHTSKPAVGPTKPPVRWEPRALSSEVKWPGREGQEVKEMWTYTSSWCSAKLAMRRNNLTFTLFNIMTTN